MLPSYIPSKILIHSKVTFVTLTKGLEIYKDSTIKRAFVLKLTRKAFDWLDGLYKIGIFGFWVNNTRGRQGKGSFLWPRLERDWDLQEDVSSLGASATKGRKPAWDQTHQKPAWYSPPEMSSAGGEIWLSKLNSLHTLTFIKFLGMIWYGVLHLYKRELHSLPPWLVP